MQWLEDLWVYDVSITPLPLHYLWISCFHLLSEFEPILGPDFWILPHSWNQTDSTLAYPEFGDPDCFNEEISDSCFTYLLGTWYVLFPLTLLPLLFLPKNGYTFTIVLCPFSHLCLHSQMKKMSYTLLQERNMFLHLVIGLFIFRGLHCSLVLFYLHRKDNGKPCIVTNACRNIMTKFGCSDYSLSHQLFYFMFADMVSARFVTLELSATDRLYMDSRGCDWWIFWVFTECSFGIL